MNLVRLTLCLTLLGNAAAAALPTPKFGYVNFEAAFAQELEAQKYIKELEAQENAISADEQKASNDLQAKIAKFKNSMAKLTEQARAAEETKLSGEYGDLQQKFGERRNKLANDRQNKLAELENKNRLLVESISRKGNYSIVFNGATLVYVSDEIKKNDLTHELITQYNKAYPVKAAPAAVPGTTPAKPAPAPAPSPAPVTPAPAAEPAKK